ncbi:hypothetical protein H7142_00955 [Candidatus Saccharibacteria bacterium]|nr:hypothetical protein [Candidatus Saccharibacteria bacterium]
MDNINRVNRPQSSDVSRPQAQRPATERIQPPKKLNRMKKPLLILGALLLVALAAGGAFYLKSQAGVAGTIDSGRYQAVFFTNGQVYFGKLSKVNGDYMRLENVYYLQNKTEATDEASPQSASAQNASDVELIKLGNEIHGPEDEMLISKDQVLFFENLKPAGTVSQTITNFQKTKK